MTTELKTTQVMHGSQQLDAVLDAKQDAGTAFASTWDPPSLTAGSYTTVNFTVAGATLGQVALAALSTGITGCLLQAHVSAANTVTVTLHNISGGTVNLSLCNINILLM